MTIIAAVIFEEFPAQCSDACNKANAFGKPCRMRDDGKKAFDRAEAADSMPPHHLRRVGVTRTRGVEPDDHR